jgi:hypothetical protein
MPVSGNPVALAWGRLTALLVAIFALSISAGMAVAQQARPPAGFTVTTPAAEAIRAARFAEPLVPSRQTTPAEDHALARALAAHEQRPRPDDLRNLAAFLADHPHSGWAPALLTNMGLSWLHYGHFSQAIDAWRRAWVIGRTATEPQARAMVDRALGELARLYASFGQMENLAALFAEIGDRAVIGSATEAIQSAREQLTLVEKDPRHLYICGPMALRALTLALGADEKQVDFLRWYRASPNGTSLSEVAGLAGQVKLAHRLVFRERGQAVPMPSIVHWKVGHFAAIVGEANGRFHVVDPVFPGRSLWVTREALEAEATGYFLVGSSAASDDTWRPVDEAEAGRVWGTGPTTGVQSGAAGDIGANQGGVSVVRGSGYPPDGAPERPPPLPGEPGQDDRGCGMCAYDIKEASVSVTLWDTPVGYTPPFGPSVKVRLAYNQREDSQPQNFTYFNVSQKWTLNWLGYVTDDPGNPGASVGSGAEVYPLEVV